jgi:sugar phosphate isomerase/epimerase
MATIDDIGDVRSLDVDFIEILVRQGDDLGRLERLLETEDRDLIVHAPERMLLDGRSWIIDLADEDPGRREAFVDRIDQVVRLAHRYGAATVVHPGGVRKHLVADPGLLARNLAESLGSIEGKVWIENMPRRYHCGEELLWSNLLRHPEEFDDVLPFVDGVTLDVCHAYLSVDKGGNAAIASFFERLKGRIKHVHLSDASYPNNEGLQLGRGDIDLGMLPRMRGLPVLLEIWGGHLNGLAGYREALAKVRSEPWFRGCIP